jgi:hypothetical protein
MMLFKDKLTLAIAEAAQAVLDESAFDDAALKWADQADEKDIKGAIDSFKQLKARNTLKGAEADISPWIKKPFKDFSTFVDSKSEVLQKKDVSKQAEKDVEHVFENQFVTIVSPNTFEASKKYGAGTKWCISGEVIKHWNDYTENSIKFYFILPKSGTKKMAVAVYPNGTAKEYYDDKDRVMRDLEFQDRLKAYKIPKEIVRVIHSNDINWDKWLQNLGGIKNSDGTVDVKNDVLLLNKELKKLPFKFRHVDGDFNCAGNILSSLEGAPETVGGNFNCEHNVLESLQGGPKSVGGSYICNDNILTSLIGAPRTIMGDFHCDANELTSLEGAPESIRGSFECSMNSDLNSLKGAPKSVGSDFSADGTDLSKSQIKKVCKVKGTIITDENVAW